MSPKHSFVYWLIKNSAEAALFHTSKICQHLYYCNLPWRSLLFHFLVVCGSFICCWLAAYGYQDK